MTDRSENSECKGHVLVITGGATGIGAATAKLAAKRGFAVVINFCGVAMLPKPWPRKSS